jgi:hypothetical protein
LVDVITSDVNFINILCASFSSKVLPAAFFALFKPKNIDAKAALKMLVKFTTGLANSDHDERLVHMGS